MVSYWKTFFGGNDVFSLKLVVKDSLCGYCFLGSKLTDSEDISDSSLRWLLYMCAS